MTAADRLSLAEDARAHVGRVIALLLSPTAPSLDRSAEELSAAIAGMERLQAEFARKPAACSSKSVLVALRRDLQRASLLLRHAWEWHAGRSGSPGYTRQGELVPQAAKRTRWVLEA